MSWRIQRENEFQENTLLGDAQDNTQKAGQDDECNKNVKHKFNKEVEILKGRWGWKGSDLTRKPKGKPYKQNGLSLRIKERRQKQAKMTVS